MASNTCSMKPVKRSAGRSATAAAAYRAGALIVDHRTGEVHDYTRKGGVVSAEIVAPGHAPAWAHDREQLWNAAEFAENRKNSQTAREFVIGLPHELSADARQELAREFAKALVERYGFAADVCIHQPGRTGDQRNHHAHILTTTRRIGPEGLTEKTRELDDRTRTDLGNGKQGPPRGTLETKWVRKKFEELTNEALERAQVNQVIDMRSYADQGLDLEPTQHMGPAAAGMERKQPGSTRIGRENQNRIERNKVREMFAQSQAADQIQIDRLVIEIDKLAGEIETVKQDLANQPSPERVAQLIRRHLEKNPPSPDQDIEDWKTERWTNVKTWASRLGEQTLQRAEPAFNQEFEFIAAGIRAERVKTVLDALTERVTPLVRQTLEWMQANDFELSVELRESLVERGYIDPPEPEKPHQGDLVAFDSLFDDDDPDTDYDRPG